MSENSNRPRFATSITLDKHDGNVYIDRERLGVYLAAEVPEIEDMAGGGGGGPYIVRIGIICDEFHIVQSLQEDLAEIREMANTHRAELGLRTKGDTKGQA